MAQYAIAFDMDTVLMRDAGLTAAQKTAIYQQEIPQALAKSGFTAHPQGSLYHTETEQDPIRALMLLQQTMREDAPQFCQFVRRVHVFRMEEWSDVTELLADHASDGAPTGEEELDEQEELEAAAT